MRELQDERGLCNNLHSRAHVRQDHADPKEGKVAVVQRFERMRPEKRPKRDNR
jgi:hypothetical protein